MTQTDATTPAPSTWTAIIAAPSGDTFAAEVTADTHDAALTKALDPDFIRATTGYTQDGQIFVAALLAGSHAVYNVGNRCEVCGGGAHPCESDERGRHARCAATVLTEREIRDICEGALSEACAVIQRDLGVPTGDYAAMYFGTTSNALADLVEYAKQEIALIRNQGGK